MDLLDSADESKGAVVGIGQLQVRVPVMAFVYIDRTFGILGKVTGFPTSAGIGIMCVDYAIIAKYIVWAEMSLYRNEEDILVE